MEIVEQKKFEEFVLEHFEDMPKYKLANVFLMFLGVTIARFDEKGQTELTKADIEKILKRLADYENDPKTTVERFLKRSAERKKDEQENS